MHNNRCSNCVARRAECTYLHGPVRAGFPHKSNRVPVNILSNFRLTTSIPEGWSLSCMSLHVLPPSADLVMRSPFEKYVKEPWGSQNRGAGALRFMPRLVIIGARTRDVTYQIRLLAFAA